MPSKALATTVEKASSEPTVSVAEAMGLPEDWSLANSLNGGTVTTAKEKPAAAEEAEEEVLPAEAVEEKTEGAEEGEKEKPAEEKAAKKGSEKSIVKGKAKPGEKAVAEKSEIEEKPVVEKPKVTVVEKPVIPAKIKVGGKEYTQEELENKLKAAEKPAVLPEAKKTPEQTSEEKLATQKEIERKDNEWIDTTSKVLTAPLDESTLDVILAGGKEAVEAMQKLRQTDMARSILLARKSMYQDLQPVIDDLRSRQEPLVKEQTQQADEREWNTFSEANPALVRYRKAVETIANALVENDAPRIAKMSMAAFQAEVAVHTKKMLKEDFSIDADAAYAAEQEAKKSEGSEEGEGKSADEKPVAKTDEKPVAEKPVRAKVAPPAGNAPSPTPGKGGKGGGGDKDIIASLW